MQEAFDSWDMVPVSIPARSRLHSIEPIGSRYAIRRKLNWLHDPACRLARGARKRPDRVRTSKQHSIFSRASGNSERNQRRQTRARRTGSLRSNGLLYATISAS